MKKRQIKRLFAFVIGVSLCIIPLAGFAADGENTAKASVAKTAQPFLAPDSDSAYVIFGDPIQQNKMEFVDGLKQGIMDAESPLYSEKSEIDGVKCRYLVKSNYAFCKLDPDFYQPGDRNFLIKVVYYDYGPTTGYFHVEYNSSDTLVSDMNCKRYSVLKPAISPPSWRTANVLITDAEFGGKMEYGADIRLANNAFNAFAMLEVINLDEAQRNGKDVILNPANENQATTLHELGLYDGGIIASGEWDAQPDKRFNRIEMLECFLQATGLKDDAQSYHGSTGCSDVTGDAAKLVGYAESCGLVDGSDGKFQPDSIATARQLLTLYLRLLGYEGNLYENAVELGEDYQLIKDENLILFPDGKLCGDQFAGIAYNALLAQGADEKTLVTRMLERGSLRQEQLDNSNNAALKAQKYTVPTKIPVNEVYDPETDRTYHYINFEGDMAFQCYFNRQGWSSDSKRFLLGSNVTNAMYEFNVETEELLFLDYVSRPTTSLAAVVTPNDQIYYQKGNTYWHMDWKTKKKEKVGEMPEGATTMSGISVTNDGRYLNPNNYLQSVDPEDLYNGKNVKRVIPVLDTKTGEWNRTLSHLFTETPDYLVYGHPIINPEYPNLMFFCHEGTTSQIPDRLWIGDVQTGETRVLFEQASLPNGLTGETSGHEMWNAKGERMYFVKYYSSTNLGQSGLVRVDKDGTHREYINDDYKYWHVSVSDNENWMAADTYGISYSHPQIVLVNTKTYESHLLTSFELTGHKIEHPYNAHPQISRDGTRIKWQMTNENDVLSIGYMDVSDIVNQEITGGRTEVSEGVTLVSYDKSEGESIKMSDMIGNTYWTVPANKGLFFDLESPETGETTGSITLEITYLDKGRQPFQVTYTGGVYQSSDLANRENKTIKVLRTNSGQWRTRRVVLSDANLQDACKFRTDVRISGGIYSSVSIRDVKIIHN